MGRRPSETQGEGGPVIFTLNHVLTAAVVEAEDLVVGVEDVGDEREAVMQPEASLQVDLQVWIEVSIAVWTVETAGSRGGATGAILILVAINVGGVVRETGAEGKRPHIVCGADVPSVGSGAQQARMIRATGQTTNFASFHIPLG